MSKAPNNGDHLTIEYGRVEKDKVCVKVLYPGVDRQTYTDVIRIREAVDRQRFVDAVCKDRPGIDRKAIAAELGDIADACTRPKPSQADLLVELSEDVDLFRGPGDDDEAFATVQVGQHRETWPVGSRVFRRYLCRQFYEHYKKVPSAQGLQDGLNVICGKAVFDGPERETYVRLAKYDGCIYMDLCDADWRVVRIDRSGWRVVADPPVRFIRKRGMLPLPVPVTGGSIDELRKFVNLPDDDAWTLLLCWIVAALRPTGPYPVLAVSGEQGAAKTSVCRLVRRLIDPNKTELRKGVRDDRDLMIAASNSWVIVLDNLSHIRPALSDGLCVLSTGGGFATRQLYSDGDEKLFDAMRPIMLNGIDDLCIRSDLADRAVTITLPMIRDTNRLDEKTLWARFDEARPQILGALLDAVAEGLRRVDVVKLDRLPRMADFARWAVACEPAFGLPEGSFIRAYAVNRQAGHEQSIEASAVGPAILRFMEDRESWSGTAGELLKRLKSDRWSDEASRQAKEWPKTGRKLSEHLKRLAADLRRLGIEHTPPEGQTGRDRRRVLRLERAESQPFQSVTSVASPDNPPDVTTNAVSGERLVSGCDRLVDGPTVDCSPKNPPDAVKNAGVNGRNDVNGRNPTDSEDGDEVIQWEG